MAGGKKKNDYFWVGFSDLMTTLFFVMLVLFVLTVVYLKVEQAKTSARVEELEKIVQLEEQFKPLRDDGDFYYLPTCKKFVAKDLMGIEIFKKNEGKIKQKYVSTTIRVGKKIESFLENIQVKQSEFSYLLVIEGNVANTYDKKWSKDRLGSYDLSYDRALAVYNLWLKNNIDFRKSNVEVLIAGSGLNGLCREEKEENNKRFSIQIIPKVSNNI